MEDSIKWFYPFILRDGSLVDCWLSRDILPLHSTRKKALEYFIKTKVKSFDTALDLACHQGYFTFELEKYFNSVTGVDRFEQSIKEAKLISSEVSNGNSKFIHSTVEDFNQPAELVLCFGVLYHVENPISFLRKISSLSQKYCIIETQIIAPSCPHIEDGTYKSTRQSVGTFALTTDYPEEDLGGQTDLAMVPDINSVLYMLDYLGFKNIELYKPSDTDYEQFKRNQRVIIYAER